jgi:predicted nucleic acid-binding protein
MIPMTELYLLDTNIASDAIKGLAGPSPGIQTLPGTTGRCGRRRKDRAARIGNLDLTIAAHALALGAVLVTNDQAFSGIKGLKIENWAA